MTTEALGLAVAMAIASGLIGCFAVMRRMSLAADPLSHVALPGVGIALALRINPIFGAAALLFFGALLVWALEQRTRAATETMIGIVFSAALAIGSMTSVSGSVRADDCARAALFGSVVDGGPDYRACGGGKRTGAQPYKHALPVGWHRSSGHCSRDVDGDVATPAQRPVDCADGDGGLPAKPCTRAHLNWLLGLIEAECYSLARLSDGDHIA
jgi:hypothetical protein